MEYPKVEELAFKQWEELKIAMRGERDKVQSSHHLQLAVECERDDEMSVTNLGNGKAVVLRYKPDRPRIQIEVGEDQGVLEFRLAFDKQSAELMEGTVPRGIDQVSVNLIRRII